MVDFKKEIARSIVNAVPELRLEEAVGFLEIPPDGKMGDFAFPCFKLAALLKKSPVQISTDLQKKILLPKSIEKVQAIGPFLNFFVKQTVLSADVLQKVLKEKQKFGFAKAGSGKIMVEFVSPNTNKPLHIGHLRNMFLGEFFSNAFETQGLKPIRTELINDRGVHICKSMLAYKKWGKDSTPKKAGKKSDHFVGDYYVMFAQKAAENPELEQEALQMLNDWEFGKPEVLKLSELMNDWALKGQAETCKKCGVEFDRIYFESQIYRKGKEIVLEGLKNGIFEKDETGAVIANLEPFKLGKKVLLRADGTSIYMTQDIFLAKKKFDDFKGLKESLTVTASEQDLHFKQLFKILELLGFDFAQKCRHVFYGYVSLPEGRMKSREGTVVDADDLISELEALAETELVKRYGNEISEKELEKRKEAIALSALKFFLLKIEAQKDFVFNPSESISFEGETGPYLLYTFARSNSILKKAPKNLLSGKADYSFLTLEKEKEISTLIARFPEVLQNSLKNYSPHVLCHYLLKLSSTFNSYYHETPVLKAENASTVKARLALVKAVGITVQNGLDILGIQALDEM
ncbi:MAG: arginine--tRNA ligase [Candidatus Diapherotrites archaeon]|nr:arginine--tRNA ligase [Candidatus Diapherotrites archaeon]